MTELLSTLLGQAGYEVETAASGRAARERFEAWRPDVAIVDLLLPDADGLELLKHFRQTDPDAEVVVLSGHATVPKAVEAMRAGAHSFMEKPVDPSALLTWVERALERRHFVGENEALKRQLADRFQYTNVVGKSHKMHEVLELVQSVAASDANVLIHGGTARARSSSRTRCTPTASGRGGRSSKSTARQSRRT